MDGIYERWSELSELVEGASELKPEEVGEFCSSACAGDPELYQLLCKLLSHQPVDERHLLGAVAQVADDWAKEDILIGQEVGSYRIDELVGRGGMGEVYLASRADGEFAKKVAIKVVRKHLPGRASTEMFRSELQVMADLSHASIPTLVDSGQLEDGRPYFICDYVEGVPVDAYCDENKLSPAGCLQLMHQIGDAVQHAHNNLVLHLDIKPENVLVRKDGTVVLLDFGVARLIGQNEDDHRAFSPVYASPEQIRNEKLSAASDVYSLGALMYRLLAGEPSFVITSQAPTETVLSQRADFVMRLAAHSKRLIADADLRAIINKTMADAPRDRYPTVDAFLRDLKHYRSHLPVSARSQTIGYRTQKFLGRYKAAVATVLLAFAVLTGFSLREASLRQSAQEASATANQVSDYMVDIFKVMDPEEARGNTITARELLDSATNRVSTELGDRPTIAAKIMRNMGDIYAGLGMYEQATLVMEDASRFSGPVPKTDDDKTERALLLTTLGKHYLTLGRFDDAETVLLQSIALTEEVFGPEHENLPLPLSSLGKLHAIKQEYSKAKVLLERSSAIAEITFNEYDIRHAELLDNLEYYFSHQGDHEKQEALLKRAVELLEAAHGPEHLSVVNALSNLAIHYVEVLRPREAIEILERAHNTALRILGPDHPVIGSYRFRLGLTHMNLANHELAETFFLEALDIQERAYGPFHQNVGSTVSYLGSLYNIMGQIDQAEQYLFRALDVMRKVHPENHTAVGYQKLALGEVLRVQGSLNEAERYTRESIESFGSMENSTLIDPTSEWQLANILRDQGRYDEAEILYARLYTWHHENPSLDAEYMLEIATQYQEFLKLLGRDEQAASVRVPKKK